MALLTGMGGSVTLPAGVSLAVTEWSANVSHELIKYRPAFGEKWTTTQNGPGEFTGTLTGYVKYDAASSEPIDLTGTDWSALEGIELVLTAETGCTYTFNATFSNFTLTRPHGGEHTATIDFANYDQTITTAWDESA